MAHIAEESTIWNVPETSEELARAAMRTVAVNATDQADARELLEMLGLVGADANRPARSAPNASPMENTGRCRKCGAHTVSRKSSDFRPRPTGAKAYGAKGMCGSCYVQARRDAAAQEVSA